MARCFGILCLCLSLVTLTHAFDPSCPSTHMDGCTEDCVFGYARDSIGRLTCECRDPCEGVDCYSKQVCLVRRSGCDHLAMCVSSIAECPASIPLSQCYVDICQLSPCNNNRSLTCIPDFCGGCFARFYEKGNHKDVTSRCFDFDFGKSHRDANQMKEGECPSLTSGMCIHSCDSDLDCLGDHLCCSNGCGTHCVPPVKGTKPDKIARRRPVSTPKTTKGMQQTPRPSSTLEGGKQNWLEISDKIGECPPVAPSQNRRCLVDCEADKDCSSVKKCCRSGCSNVCQYPVNATGCVHLRAAIEQLGSSVTGWLPTCTPMGDFTAVQCSRTDCWCVDRSGHELPQTRNSEEPPTCPGEHTCGDFDCPLKCPHGYKLDLRGCPTCACSNLCENVLCNRGFEVCHLIAADCGKKFCPPVPICVPNVCPVGSPIGFGLCRHNFDCPASGFCHSFGYAGLGLCCISTDEVPSSPSAIACPAVAPQPDASELCSLECKLDMDCINGICCYNGCGTQCVRTSGVGVETTTSGRAPTTIAQPETTPTPELLLSNAECPLIPADVGGPCLIACQKDIDCAEDRRCCPVGCSFQCVRPTGRRRPALPEKETSTEPPPSSFRTSDLCPPKSDRSSGLEPRRCGRGCESDTGCRLNEKCCMGSCGYLECTAISSATVPRKNPHQTVQAHVTATPPKPTTTTTTTPRPRESTTTARPSKDGDCPKFSLRIISRSAITNCERECELDEECPGLRKCCGYACAAVCMEAEQGTTKSADKALQVDRREVSMTNKPGSCPSPPSDVTCTSDISDCSTDAHCPGARKCCFDGCSLRCMYADVTTACLHMQAHMEMANLEHMKPTCTPEGAYDPVQCRGSTCWCVSELGNKVPGTLSHSARPDCEDRRSCSTLRNCSLSCPYGYRLDNTGCPVCMCEKPCAEIVCGKAHELCMLVEVTCPAGEECMPLPKCVLNVCSQGAPVRKSGIEVAQQCASNSDCSPRHYCQLMGTASGYCCMKPAPAIHPGSCPMAQFPYGSCEAACRKDSDCSANAKCCFNGCGTGCVESGEESSVREGQCPFVQVAEDASCTRNCWRDSDCPRAQRCCPVRLNGCMMCMPVTEEGQAAGTSTTEAPVVMPKVKHGQCTKPSGYCHTTNDECKDDSDCEGIKKCCKNMCGAAVCQYADSTTNCLHLKGAIETILSEGGLLTLHDWNPTCLSDGRYSETQCSKRRCWCVDSMGLEIPGTTVTGSTSPNCLAPRVCRMPNCQLQCPYGYDLDEAGCEICECFDPCKGVKCAYPFHFCKLEHVHCLSEECLPVPKCVMNVCPAGVPARHETTWNIERCGTEEDCPRLHFCHKIGFLDDSGYCCAQPKPTIRPGACPILQEFPTRMASLCQQTCKADTDCRSDQKCCYNGCGFSCVIAEPQASTARPQGEVTRTTEGTRGPIIEPTRGHISTTLPPGRNNLQDKIGICPANPISNPGCRRECMNDFDCRGAQKCCQFGCGSKCQMPRNTTTCIKLTSALEALQASTIPKCNPSTGYFDEIQCSNTECWCVDVNTGVEVQGTRAPVLGNADCINPRQCPTQCTQLDCQHGVLLDKKGCPLNGECKCLDLCQGITCPAEKEICVMESEDCTRSPCSSAPACVRHSCGNAEPMMDPASKQPFLCTGYYANECGSTHTCRIRPGAQTGFCCALDTGVTTEKIGRCADIPNVGACARRCTQDNTCASSEKCCNNCCRPPHNTTNCLHYKSAAELLNTENALVPSCDERSGLFTPVQCNPRTGTCWCVDTITGIEHQGTRIQGPKPNCNTKTVFCAIMCDVRFQCPLGLALDNIGCPRQGCPCRDPCKEINCPTGTTCTLQQTACLQEPCTPVPACIRNPCRDGGVPARNPYNLITTKCRKDSDCVQLTHECEGEFCCPKRVDLAATNPRPIERPVMPTVDRYCADGQALVDVNGRVVTCDKRSSSAQQCMEGYSCVTDVGSAFGLCCSVPTTQPITVISPVSNPLTSKVRFRLLNNGFGAASNQQTTDELMQYLATYGIVPNQVRNVQFLNDDVVEVELEGTQSRDYVSKLSNSVDEGPFRFRFNGEVINTEEQSNTSSTPSSFPQLSKIMTSPAIGAEPAQSGPNRTILVSLIASCAAVAVIAVIGLTAAFCSVNRGKRAKEGMSKLLLDSYGTLQRSYYKRGFPSAAAASSSSQETSINGILRHTGSMHEDPRSSGYYY